MAPYNATVDIHPTVAEKAVRLAFGLVRSHPFLDGNKRVATACLGALLRLNGFEFKSSADELLATILGVAAAKRPARSRVWAPISLPVASLVSPTPYPPSAAFAAGRTRRALARPRIRARRGCGHRRPSLAGAHGHAWARSGRLRGRASKPMSIMRRAPTAPPVSHPISALGFPQGLWTLA